jgi:hypothetical protein
MYWRRNDFSIWRYVDILWVQIGLWYQMYRAMDSSFRAIYYAVIAVGVCSFATASYFARSTDNKAHQTRAFICHSLVHVLGNIGNFVLYSSVIEPN